MKEVNQNKDGHWEFVEIKDYWPWPDIKKGSYQSVMAYEVYQDLFLPMENRIRHAEFREDLLRKEINALKNALAIIQHKTKEDPAGDVELRARAQYVYYTATDALSDLRKITIKAGDLK